MAQRGAGPRIRLEHMLSTAGAGGGPARLTVQPGSPAVSPVEEVSHVLRYPLHYAYLVRMQLPVRAQAGCVVYGFGRGGLIQPLLQPFQRDEVVRGTWERTTRRETSPYVSATKPHSRWHFIITLIFNGAFTNEQAMAGGYISVVQVGKHVTQLPAQPSGLLLPMAQGDRGDLQCKR